MSTDLLTFLSLADEVAALLVQVRDYGSQVQMLEAKNLWLTRLVYGAKSERRPVAQDLGAAQQETFLLSLIHI